MPGSLPGEKPARRRREETSPPVFPRSPRVLILSAAVGAGHVRPAEAPVAALAACASLDVVEIEGRPAFPAPELIPGGHRPRRRRSPL